MTGLNTLPVLDYEYAHWTDMVCMVGCSLVLISLRTLVDCWYGATVQFKHHSFGQGMAFNIRESTLRLY
jgi:hypothetical protein